MVLRCQYLEVDLSAVASDEREMIRIGFGVVEETRNILYLRKLVLRMLCVVQSTSTQTNRLV